MATRAVRAKDESSVDFQVRVLPGALEQIRSFTVQAADTSGGIIHDAALLLVGVIERDAITVHETRPFPPLFSFSDLAQQNSKELRAFLKSTSAELKAEHRVLVGWSSPRSSKDLFLLDREVNFHNQHFPELDKIIILAKAVDKDVVTASFFVRNIDGSFDHKNPSTTAELVPPGFEPASRRPTQRTPATLSDNRFLEAYRSLTKADSNQEVLTGAAALGDTERTPLSRTLGLVAVGLVAALAIFWFGTAISKKSARSEAFAASIGPEELALSLLPKKDNLVLTWRSNIEKAKSATLRVTYDSTGSDINLTETFQKSGVVYLPHTKGNVKAMLTVETGNHRLTQTAEVVDPGKYEVADSLEQPPNSADPKEVQRLTDNNRRLAALVSVLRSRKRQQAP